MPGLNEADTCRIHILPKLQAVGWDWVWGIKEQHCFTDGRIIASGGKVRRREGKRADYLLRYRPDMPLAVVEAKPEDNLPSTGLQQAKEYASILGLKFAYATNGHGIIEFDFTTGQESERSSFPSPEELWNRFSLAEALTPVMEERLLTPGNTLAGKTPRYYQLIAINRAVQAALQGRERILLTLATGTGKTVVAFQICWKLWSARWNRRADPTRRPRMLFLADRTVLVDDPKDKDFAPFGDARHKLEHGVALHGREMYFATYQSIAGDSLRSGLFKEYPSDFFDLIVVDECHRGSAREESTWREILDHFSPACQVGMTATPLRDDNIDTYRYFGTPLYTYSLAQGIDDGFLAPYRVHRVVTTWDAAGWRPNQGDLDRYGRDIPDGQYLTPDFERRISLRARTDAVARHLTDFLHQTDRMDKTIIFCVDQEHADAMRRALNNLNTDITAQHSDYVCRVTADEGDIGRGHLARFQDVEKDYPVILTTSQLLSTGVDAPTVQNVVLVRIVGSMTEFKQIIGRGTRVREDCGKLFFNILDYTGSATRHFADPDFDGDPVIETEETIDELGETIAEEVVVQDNQEPEEKPVHGFDPGLSEGDGLPRKFYFDGGRVEIAAHLVSELDPDGKQLHTVSYTDYTAGKVRTLARDADDLRHQWANPDLRQHIVNELAERGIEFDLLADQARFPDADPLDLLSHLAFNTPLLTRKERANRLRKAQRDFFAAFAPEARKILDEILEKYAEHGLEQFRLPEVLQVPPISRHGTLVEIAKLFGGTDKLLTAVQELQTMLYAA